LVVELAPGSSSRPGVEPGERESQEGERPTQAQGASGTIDGAQQSGLVQAGEAHAGEVRLEHADEHKQQT
jgi:hypothetical protein